jgi:hypothetical protein
MREREGVWDTPSWIAGPRVGAGGGVVAIATVSVEAVRAAARTRSRRPSGRQRVTPRVSKPHDYANHMFMRL